MRSPFNSSSADLPRSRIFQFGTFLSDIYEKISHIADDFRLKSVKNIQKITKSMKMVAAAKYAKAERELKGARSYGEGAQAFYDNLGATPESADAAKSDAVPPEGKKRLLVLITSDRGLCGSVHTSIIKV